MASNKYAVIGIGQFGKAIAKAISAKGYEVMAITMTPKLLTVLVTMLHTLWL